MVVLDSSSIISFLRAGKFSLFRELWPRGVRVPEGVFKEVYESKKGVGVFTQAALDWMTVEKTDEKQLAVLSLKEDLTSVDAEVLLLALKHGDVLVSGDRQLIQAAKAHGLLVLWTTEVVLEAVKQKKLSKKQAQQTLDDLVQSGLRIRVEIYAALQNFIEKM